MSVSEEERTNPTPEQWEELLELLVGAHDAGQLVSLTFMLRNDMGTEVVDFRGPYDQTEVACRTVRERIAANVDAVHPDIAASIRATNAALKMRKH